MEKIKIDNYITEDIKKELWKKSKILMNQMYDRQGDRKTQNRRKKIYLGLISEYIFEEWFKKKFPDKKIEKWEKEGVDKYDFKINNEIYIDIKSSKERKEYNGNDFKQFILNNRNFTLPVDQVKKEFLDKNYYIIQIIYDFNFEHCYISNGIKLNNLIKKENYKELKLDNNNIQKTYMTLLKNEENTFLNFNKKKFNLAVIGSRTYNNYLEMEKILNHLIQSLLKKNIIKNKKDIQIISGGAKGADNLARKYAKLNDIEIIEILPEWKKYGNAAGFKRNYKIWEKADFGIGFWDGKSSGTKQSIKIANDMNKDLIMYIYPSKIFKLYDNDGDIVEKIKKEGVETEHGPK